jgi:hypothetical protein
MEKLGKQTNEPTEVLKKLPREEAKIEWSGVKPYRNEIWF